MHGQQNIKIYVVVFVVVVVVVRQLVTNTRM